MDDQFDDLFIIGSLKNSHCIGHNILSHNVLHSQVYTGLDDSRGQTFWFAIYLSQHLQIFFSIK